VGVVRSAAIGIAVAAVSVSVSLSLLPAQAGARPVLGTAFAYRGTSVHAVCGATGGSITVRDWYTSSGVGTHRVDLDGTRVGFVHRSAVSGGDGYRFTRVAAGRHVVEFSATEGAAVRRAVTVCPASVTIGRSQRLTRGTGLTVVGRVRDGSGRPVQHARMKLYARVPGGTFHLVGAVHTSQHGAARLRVRPAHTVEYRWIYRGDAHHARAKSPIQTVYVSARQHQRY
jgi:hypothetical protein